MSLTKRGLKKTLAKVKKDLKLKKTSKNKSGRTAATIVLAQGAVAPPRKNFGTRSAGKKSNPSMLAKCLDARVPRTLGLPRAVAPYTVIRTTKMHRSTSSVLVFGTFMHEQVAGAHWRNWCGIEAVDSTLGIDADDNTKSITMEMSNIGYGACLVPAAITVQVMCPKPLQLAGGLYAMCRVNQNLDIGGSPRTYDNVRDTIISYFSPRMLTGGKLALRGVKCSAAPMDMGEYSDFCPLETTAADHVFKWTSGTARPAALTPIVFVRDAESTDEAMSFMITVEWRVRFDPQNPAAASHTHHDILSDGAWNQVQKTMAMAGHGVEELAQDATEAGAMGYGALKALATVGELAV